MALILLAGCSADPELPARVTEQPPNSEIQEASIASVAFEEPSAAAQEEIATDYCLECHSDKQRLIDNAKPEEKVIKESEGAG
jgi:hypothetical protein